MKKKILFIVDTISIGGAELSILELVKNISNFEILICIVYKAQNQFKAEFEKLGVKLIFFDINKRFGFFEGAVKLSKLLRNENPDIVHATHFKAEIISRIVVPFYNIPLVGSLISDTYSKERYALVTTREKMKLECYRYIDKLTAFRSDLYISVSEAIVKPNVKYLGIPHSKIIVIPNGRNVEKYDRAIPVPRQSFNKKIKDSDLLIVSNSRVVQSKGFDEMFKAFQLLNKDFHRLYFLVVGGGENFNHYKALSIEYGIENKVIFIGDRMDMPEILKSCDIFWFASHYEGSPGVIIEGMLSQLPIIASNITSVIENLVDGENALLFSKGNAMELARKTRFLLENWSMKKEIINKAYRLGINKFNIKKLAQHHEKVYNEVIFSNR